MYKYNVLMGMLLFSAFSAAETANEPSKSRGIDNNIFAVEENVLLFQTEKQLLSYLKLNKPSTFRYFERLSFQSKKQVFQKHQADSSQDITDIVLMVYRKNR